VCLHIFCLLLGFQAFFLYRMRLEQDLKSMDMSLTRDIKKSGPPEPTTTSKNLTASATTTTTTETHKEMPGARIMGESAFLMSDPVMVQPSATEGGGADARQIMRLLDALQTLGNENTHLLAEVEGARAAREEAKKAESMMEQFKKEYSQRFASLRGALDIIRDENTHGVDNHTINVRGPETDMDANTRRLQEELGQERQILMRREQKIASLQSELERQKAENAVREEALHKYEKFYRQVKERNEQKKRRAAASTSAAVTSGSDNNIGGSVVIVQQQGQQQVKQKQRRPIAPGNGRSDLNMVPRHPNSTAGGGRAAQHGPGKKGTGPSRRGK